MPPWQQSPSVRAKILAYLQTLHGAVPAAVPVPAGTRVEPPTAPCPDEINYHAVVGSRNLLAQQVIIAAFAVCRDVMERNLTETRTRDRALGHLYDALNTSLSALGNMPSSEPLPPKE